jgi:pantoate--beta-alanine ligase
MYEPETRTSVCVAELSDLHCGQFRSGHFTGVATVVLKLFNMVQPDCALFGQKDFQQLTIIKTMARDLNVPVDIIPVATVRDADGLALSSRNGYLSSEEKRIAPKLYQMLGMAKDAVMANREFADIERHACDYLANAGFITDYFSIGRQSDLKKAERTDRELVILAAARLGKTRLIDNLCFNRSGGNETFSQ